VVAAATVVAGCTAAALTAAQLVSPVGEQQSGDLFLVVTAVMIAVIFAVCAAVGYSVGRLFRAAK
jgi:hypothetical protein